MSTVIKNGTIVTADLTYKADVLIEDGRIAAIGDGLSGDRVLDATGCYVMPGGIDPHTHLEMPFMGTTAAETFESGTAAAASGVLTVMRTISEPAWASWRTWMAVSTASTVSVLVMDCTRTGASPPTVTTLLRHTTLA